MCYTVWQPYRLMTGAAICGCLPTNAWDLDPTLDHPARDHDPPPVL